ARPPAGPAGSSPPGLASIGSLTQTRDFSQIGMSPAEASARTLRIKPRRAPGPAFAIEVVIDGPLLIAEVRRERILLIREPLLHLAPVMLFGENLRQVAVRRLGTNLHVEAEGCHGLAGSFAVISERFQVRDAIVL